MNGVTWPVIGFTVTIRELLLFPLWVWVDWLESVANSSPPAELGREGPPPGSLEVLVAEGCGQCRSSWNISSLMRSF